MNIAAHLVVVLDTEHSPPVVLGCAVWSQNDEHLGRHRTQATILTMHGEDFASARDAVLDCVDTWPALSWVRGMLEERR